MKHPEAMKNPERRKHPERPPISASGAPVRRLLVWAALAVPLASGPFQDVRAGCREVAKPLLEALAARDLDAARRHYEAVDNEFTCTDEYRADAKRAVSGLHLQVAQERLAGGASLASLRALLEKGLKYTRSWKYFALLGDVVYDARDYHRAAVLYQSAIVAINDEADTPQPPPDSDSDRIHSLAVQSRMLADRHVATPTNRKGEPDGLAAPSIRGAKIKKVVLPITFEFDSAEFDALGRQYAEELAEALIGQEASGPITLSAHTDASGSDAYNLALSQRRGEAVHRFLQAWFEKKGVTRTIKVLAMGEREPLDLYDPEHYKQAEVDRMNRRVVWVRGDGR